ncbi:triosephosphate isomerase [Wolbachia endosymbiont of Howardula sp.]|uniref:triosephosphate isomerase n=1 Tax=Wolbachia endosymbiont of Howardula sp. TaxID=2916816 RepID=UPI00217DCAA6|nr:triosephosphate isomerase [Wolbachia endosymbiont of Howardula sp.]UWI83236.1 triosephosphate isomerase [Wolbachia endosymbiont of Howardula sp.]
MSFLIVANWKMHGTRKSFTKYIAQLNNINQSITSRIVICPPFTALLDVINVQKNVYIGAQNCHYEYSGSYTGEISVQMLQELGCTYVIVGHSERMYEQDRDIRLKAETAIACHVHPIICIGENLEEHRSENIKYIIESQCNNRLPTYGEYTIAYEPIWIIGTGSMPNIASITKTLDMIISYTGTKSIIYGGAVNRQSIKKVLEISSISGVLIGSASLEFDHFENIIYQIEQRHSID